MSVRPFGRFSLDSGIVQSRYGGATWEVAKYGDPEGRALNYYDVGSTYRGPERAL